MKRALAEVDDGEITAGGEMTADGEIYARILPDGSPQVDQPSVKVGSARAEKITGSPLEGALLPTALMDAPVEVALRLNDDDCASGAAQVARQIAARGMCLCRCGLSPELGVAAAAEAANLYSRGELQTMGFVKKGVRVPPDPEQRRDLCVMLTDQESHRLHGVSQALLAIDAAIERFAHILVDQLALLEPRERAPLGGGPCGERLRFSSRGDLMVAVYPGEGSFHGVHIDNQDGDGRTTDFGRVLTFIYFLNEGWDEGDGGALRLHLPRECGARDAAVAEAHASERSPAIDVLPALDRMAVFRADRVMHEVRPCPVRHRYAASVWVTCGAVGGACVRECE